MKLLKEIDGVDVTGELQVDGMTCATTTEVITLLSFSFATVYAEIIETLKTFKRIFAININSPPINNFLIN